VAKSRPPTLILGWRNDDADCFTKISLFRLVGPSLQPREVGLFPGTGCMVSLCNALIFEKNRIL
jgi:hypothetical protein